MRVLVADDDHSIRHLLSTLVAKEGIEVDTVNDGAAAIDLLEQRRYSVVLLDLMMPKLDGFAVIDFLAQQQPEPKPVVLIVTAYADQTFKAVNSEVVSGVIRKPFEIAEIGAVVRRCVSGYQESGREETVIRKQRAPFLNDSADEQNPN